MLRPCTVKHGRVNVWNASNLPHMHAWVTPGWSCPPSVSAATTWDAPAPPPQTQEGTNAVIAAAVEAGIGFFDIADLYGAEPGLSETMFGTAMRELNLSRDDLIIVTKFGLPTGTLNGNDWDARGSRRYIMRAVEVHCAALEPSTLTCISTTAPTRTPRWKRPCLRSTRS